MNQDQIKLALSSIRTTAVDFTVILTGKKSNKVNGLYKPESREILLHNRNFTTDNELMYTAIHEYAHHIQFTTSATPISVRAHTTAFWSLFHSLLFDAERKGVYVNPFEGIEEFKALTREIKEKFIAVSGALMKDLGKLLIRAHELCDRHGTSFSDYIDRILGLPRVSAQAIMKADTYNLNPRVGFENMRSLAGIRDDGMRNAAQEALLAGKSPDMVKMSYGGKKKPAGAREVLVEERKRIERTIDRLKAKLKEIDKRLDELTGDQPPVKGKHGRL
jgi:hypothetical protein